MFGLRLNWDKYVYCLDMGRLGLVDAYLSLFDNTGLERPILIITKLQILCFTN